MKLDRADRAAEDEKLAAEIRRAAGEARSDTGIVTEAVRELAIGDLEKLYAAIFLSFWGTALAGFAAPLSDLLRGNGLWRLCTG